MIQRPIPGGGRGARKKKKTVEVGLGRKKVI